MRTWSLSGAGVCNAPTTQHRDLQSPSGFAFGVREAGRAFQDRPQSVLAEYQPRFHFRETCPHAARARGRVAKPRHPLALPPLVRADDGPGEIACPVHRFGMPRFGSKRKCWHFRLGTDLVQISRYRYRFAIKLRSAHSKRIRSTSKPVNGETNAADR